MASSSNTAFQTFNLANDIYELSPQDEIFKFDVEANKALNREAPWSKECVRFDYQAWSSMLISTQRALLQVVQDLCCGIDQDGTQYSVFHIVGNRVTTV